MSYHAILSPSGFDALMSCPGKPAMEADEPSSSSTYADEGSAAHFLASWVLENEASLTAASVAKYAGRRIEVLRDSQRWFAEDADGAYPVFDVDGEMVRAIGRYVEQVRGYAGADGAILAEQRVPIDHVTGEPGATGTSDAIIILDNEIVVMDLKYGQGVAVSAENNPQLMLYALGALRNLGDLLEPKTVRLVISQPRISPTPSEWSLPVSDLLGWAASVATPAAARAWAIYQGSVSLDDLQPGDACTFCRAKVKCPKLAQAVQEAVGDDFEDLTKTTTSEIKTRVASLSPAELSVRMSACDLLEDFIKAVRARVEADLLSGVQIPDYKLVRGKKGNRQWTDEDEAMSLLKSMKLKVEEMYSMKLISPTTAEKIFGEGGTSPSAIRWKKLQSLIEQKEGSISVAHASDKRQAITPASADDFTDGTGSDLA